MVEVSLMESIAVSALTQESTGVILKFLNDPQISPELKAICFRLTSHQYIEKLLEQTPASAIFWICEEYRKHPDLYDDIFNGKIKFFRKGAMDKAVPLFNEKIIEDHSSLKNLFEPDKLIRQVVEKFVTFETGSNQIRRIAVEVNGNKMLTVAFNSEKKIVSMLIDYINAKQRTNAFMKFLNDSAKKRIDLIRF